MTWGTLEHELASVTSRSRTKDAWMVERNGDAMMVPLYDTELLDMEICPVEAPVKSEVS